MLTPRSGGVALLARRPLQASDRLVPGGGCLGDAPVLLQGELRGYSGEEEEYQGRTRDVPVPLDERGQEVDHERAGESGQQDPALVPPRPPGSPHGVTYQRDYEADEGNEGEDAGLGTLLEVEVVDLLGALGIGSLLEPDVLEGPSPRPEIGR